MYINIKAEKYIVCELLCNLYVNYCDRENIEDTKLQKHIAIYYDNFSLQLKFE